MAPVASRRSWKLPAAAIDLPATSGCFPSYFKEAPLGDPRRVAAIRGTFLRKPYSELWLRIPLWQRQAAYRTGFLPVTGSDGGQFYVAASWGAGFSVGSVYNWRAYDKPRRGRLGVLQYMCLVIEQATPWDAVIAKYWLLKADESLFRYTANTQQALYVHV